VVKVALSAMAAAAAAAAMAIHGVVVLTAFAAATEADNGTSEASGAPFHLVKLLASFWYKYA
jgi:hypothetical protein